jgi:multiple sugar transport system ATP-binding protein
MHDGIVEQIGTPLELFDRPGNLFVAQFIGSPAMNILQGQLHVAAGRAWVEAQGAQWPVPAGVRASDGQAVHYGIRPTNVQVSASGEGIPAKVIVVEPTGAETELLLQVGDAQLVVVVHGRTKVQPDETVRLSIDPAASHLFESAGGKRIDSVTLQ